MCMNTFSRTAVAMILALVLSACAGSATRSSGLYADMGGADGTDRLITAILDRIYADERIAFLFKDTDRPVLHTKLVEQFCMEAGGGCEYTGLSMQETHSGMALTASEFDIFVEDVILGMEDVGLNTPTQNRLLRIFAPMRPDVIHP